MHGWPLAVGPKAGMGWLSNRPFPRDQGRLNDFGGLRRNSKIGPFFFFFLALCNELVFFFFYFFFFF
jgi:hypothetical protein